MSYGLDSRTESAIPVAQKSIAAASITNSYSIVGSIFSNPVVMIIIVSTLHQTVQISWDGVTDHIVLPALGTMILDFKSDKIVLGGSYGIYVKEIGNPTSGSLYVSAFTL